MPDRTSFALELHQLGQRIRQLRRERGLTQEALAIRAGVRTDRLKAWEYGICEAGVLSLHRLAKALEVPVRALLSDPPADWVDDYQGRGRPRKRT